MEQDATIRFAADIVAAYVSRNRLSMEDLPGLITEVGLALRSVSRGVQQAPVQAPTPAVPVKKSITPDFIISLETGAKLKSLTRHLRSLGMTPDDYREKWGLPSNYPLVAPNYAARRSEIARDMNFGKLSARRKGSKKKTAGATG